MTTYTVTINNEIYLEVTPATLKTMRKNNVKGAVKAVKNIETPAVKCYYRGSEVLYIEGRQNGWTLVHVPAKGTDVFAVTAELEYR